MKEVFEEMKWQMEEEEMPEDVEEIELSYPLEHYIMAILPERPILNGIDKHVKSLKEKIRKNGLPFQPEDMDAALENRIIKANTKAVPTTFRWH